ncbi:MAG: sugar phosphate nucleotidyltransferase [Candidatus Altiarchaeota archaeon]
MKAVILAGGFGTRMRPLTFSRPKPLMPLLNRPVTAHILDHLKGHGVTEVAITTNYLREQIQAHFGSEYLGMKLTYPFEAQPLGTAGSVKNIQEYFDDTFIVMQGDTITDMDLTSLLTQHKYYSGLATIAAVKVDDPWNYGVMELGDDGRVRQFFEKPMIDECKTNMANTGIYVLEPEALDHIPANTFYDFAKDLFPKLLERQSLFASQTDGFWVDIGRPEGYNRAKKWMMSRIESEIPDSSILDGRLEGRIRIGQNVKIGIHSHLIGPIVVGDNVTIDKDCVIGPYTVLGSGSEVKYQTVLNGAVLFENINIGAGGDVGNGFIAENCKISLGARIQSDTIIGGNCTLEENVSVINGSRIWPNIGVSNDSMVSGTIKRFVPAFEVHYDPQWSLRKVTPDEAFYFNKLEGNRVMFTGARALSLTDFNSILKHIDASSVKYHMRSEVNDFEQWSQYVLCDLKLAEAFREIKREYARMDAPVIRHTMVDATTRRLNELIDTIKRKGYA